MWPAIPKMSALQLRTSIGRDRAVDGGRQEVEPLRPSGRDYDPDRLSPRLAGVRVVRSAMVAGRAGHRTATRAQGEERLAECRALRRLQREQGASSHVFMTE